MEPLIFKGVEGLPAPMTYTVELQDLDSTKTTRNARGKNTRDRIRGGWDVIRAINVVYEDLTLAEMALILQTIMDQDMDVEYTDPLVGGRRTANFYTGNRSAVMKRFYRKNGNVDWASLTFKIVEN